MRCVLNNDKALSRSALECHTKAAALDEEFQVVELPEEGIVGVGLWFGPGQSIFER